MGSSEFQDTEETVDKSTTSCWNGIFDYPTFFWCTAACLFVAVFANKLVKPLETHFIISFREKSKEGGALGETKAWENVVRGLTSVLLGYLSDRPYVTRKLLLLSLIGFSLSEFLIAFCNSGEQLIGAFCIQAVFNAFTTLFLSLIAKISPPQHRHRYMSALWAGYYSAFSLGSLAGGYVTDALELAVPQARKRYSTLKERITYCISGTISLIASLGAYFVIPRSRPMRARRLISDLTSDSEEEKNRTEAGTPYDKQIIILLVISQILINFAWESQAKLYQPLLGHKFYEHYNSKERTEYQDHKKHTKQLFGLATCFSGIICASTQLIGVPLLVPYMGEYAACCLSAILNGLGVSLFPKMGNRYALIVLREVNAIGYAIHQGLVGSIISKHSKFQDMGKSMGFLEAGRFTAKALAPYVAGMLWDKSKDKHWNGNFFGNGYLPFFVCLPAAFVNLMIFLYLGVLQKSATEDEQQSTLNDSWFSDGVDDIEIKDRRDTIISDIHITQP